MLLLLQVAFACGSRLDGICTKLKSSTGGTQSTWIASYGNFDLLNRFPASNLGLEAIQCFKKRIWRQIRSNSNSNGECMMASQFMDLCKTVMRDQGLGIGEDRMNYEATSSENGGAQYQPVDLQTQSASAVAP